MRPKGTLACYVLCTALKAFTLKGTTATKLTFVIAPAKSIRKRLSSCLVACSTGQRTLCLRLTDRRVLSTKPQLTVHCFPGEGAMMLLHQISKILVIILPASPPPPPSKPDLAQFPHISLKLVQTFEIYLYKPQQRPGRQRSVAQLNLCALAYSWAQGSKWKSCFPSFFFFF